MTTSRRDNGFTLVELAVVVAILAILLALLLPLLRPAAGATTAAKATLQKISMGVRTLKAAIDLEGSDFLGVDDAGRALPVDAEGWHVWTDKAGVTRRFEIGRELDPSNPAWAKVFTPYRNRGTDQHYGSSKKERANGQVIDPWGTPYRYEIHVPPNMGGKIEAERLVSAGEDRQWGTEDDLVFDLVSRERPEP